jgi:hypothetical protein
MEASDRPPVAPFIWAVSASLTSTVVVVEVLNQIRGRFGQLGSF